MNEGEDAGCWREAPPTSWVPLGIPLGQAAPTPESSNAMCCTPGLYPPAGWLGAASHHLQLAGGHCCISAGDDLCHVFVSPKRQRCDFPGCAFTGNVGQVRNRHSQTCLLVLAPASQNTPGADHWWLYLLQTGGGTGNDVRPLALTVGAQRRAIAQARHLHLSGYHLETQIRAVGTFRFPLIHHPQQKTECEGRDTSFRLSPASRAFYSTPSG